MRTLLAEMNHATQEWYKRGENRIPAQEREEWIHLYDTILRQGYQQLSPPPERAPHQRGKLKQSKAKFLLEVLDKRREQVIGFLDDTSEDFTNNQREHDLRMLKVKETISGGFRSDAGVSAFCAVRSVVSTFRKQHHRALEIIRSLFLHHPIPFAISYE